MVQPSNVYDKDADEHPVHHDLPAGNSSDPREAYNPQAGPLNDSSDPRSELRDAEQEGGLFNPGGDETTSKRPTNSSALSDSEKSSARGSLYNSNPSGNGRFSKAKGSLARFSGKKWLLGGLAGSGAFFAGLFILLLIIAGSLKIPNLAQHITEYEFAKVVRQFTQTSQNITEESLAVQSLDDSAYGRLKANYQNLRDNTWGKLDNYRPGKVIQNMKGDGALKLNYKTTVTGRQQLTEVVLNDATYNVESQGYTRFVPGLGSAIKFKNGITFSKNFAPTLTESLKTDQIGPVIRGRVAKQIRQELGINLVAWNIGKYTGKDEVKARLQQERDTFNAVSEKGTDASVTQPIREAEQAADDTLQNDINDDKSLQAIIDNNGSDPNVEQVIESKVAASDFEKAIAFANGSYAGAIAACTIYDGSLTASGPTINAQTASQQRAYYYIQSASDQQKYGETTGEAVGALNDKTGDITNSNPEIRSAGGNVDTSSSLSSEASAGGDYTILSTILGTGFIGTVTNSLVGAACQPLTNIVVGTAGAVVLGALAIIPGVGEAESAATGAVDATSETLTQRIVTSLNEKFASSFGSKEAAKESIGKINAKARFIAKDTVKSGAKITAATILAKLIVMAKSHQLNNGLEQNAELANEADAGGNQAANNIEQRQFYGRPQTQAESAQNHSADLVAISAKNKTLSPFERYLAISNPDSLLNRAATLTASTAHNSFFPSFTSLGSKLFNPLGSVGHLFGSWIMPHSLAAATSTNNNSDYGNVQWGYSADEMSLLKNDSSYRPLENQKILDDSGQSDAITTKYGKCFDGSEQIGDMLANGDIVRDKDGNVVPDLGLCSPNNLGLNNSEFGPRMIFRWRVAHNYSNGLDQLGDEQDVTTDTSSGSSGSGSLPSGSAQSLATQLKPYVDQGKIKCLRAGCSDIANTASGTSIKGGEGCLVDALDKNLVGMLLELVKMGHTFTLSALCSDHGNDGMNEHSGGHAADFNTIDGVFMGPQDAPWDSTKTAAAEKLDRDVASFMPKTTEFGQVGAGHGHPQCHPGSPAFSFQSGFHNYPDFCHHQHIRAGD